MFSFTRDPLHEMILRAARQPSNTDNSNDGDMHIKVMMLLQVTLCRRYSSVVILRSRTSKTPTHKKTAAAATRSAEFVNQVHPSLDAQLGFSAQSCFFII